MLLKHQLIDVSKVASIQKINGFQVIMIFIVIDKLEKKTIQKISKHQLLSVSQK